jgi:hypothetical protein
MTGKAAFAPAEWNEILASPLMAATAVSAADPSGLLGLLKENFASAKALIAAKQTSGSLLVKAIVADLETSDGRTAARAAVQARFSGSSSSDIKSRSIEALRQVAAYLDKTALDESAAVKTWLHDIAQSVAEASSEGGFFGIGGVTVSDAEKASLSEVNAALGRSTA